MGRNVEVAHAPRPRSKTTLNVLYRLTTEMGRNVKVAHAPRPTAKTTLNVLYRLTTEMRE